MKLMTIEEAEKIFSHMFIGAIYEIDGKYYVPHHPFLDDYDIDDETEVTTHNIKAGACCSPIGEGFLKLNQEQLKSLI